MALAKSSTSPSTSSYAPDFAVKWNEYQRIANGEGEGAPWSRALRRRVRLRVCEIASLPDDAALLGDWILSSLLFEERLVVGMEPCADRTSIRHSMPHDRVDCKERTWPELRLRMIDFLPDDIILFCGGAEVGVGVESREEESGKGEKGQAQVATRVRFRLPRRRVSFQSFYFLCRARHRLFRQSWPRTL